MPTRHDYHIHSTYSDGADPAAMIETAERLDLDGIGFADHVLLSHPEKAEIHDYPMDLDAIDERTSRLERLAEATDIDVFVAVEIDYYPHDEEVIEAFIESNAFDYVIGSVHELGEYHPDDPQPSIHHNDAAPFEGMEEGERTSYVDRYFERLVTLIESDLADIIAHLDLIERNRALKGLATSEHYHRVAEALERSPAVPEINGTTVDEAWPVLPRKPFFEVLGEYDVEFVRGSDAHGTASLETRNGRIDRIAAEYDLTFRTYGLR